MLDALHAWRSKLRWKRAPTGHRVDTSERHRVVTAMIHAYAKLPTTTQPYRERFDVHLLAAGENGAAIALQPFRHVACKLVRCEGAFGKTILVPAAP